MDTNGAAVFAFPIERRVDLVRRTVGELTMLNGENANDYWRALARRLLAELMEQGRDMEQARKDVLRFFETVQMELRSQVMRDRSTMPA
jgi:hypothetical protein